MWYASFMPETLPTAQIESAEAAIEFAQSVRKVHRRKTSKDSPQRIADIETAQERLKDAMGPLRGLMGRFPYGPQTSIAEKNRARIRATSKAIQAERRKLWKLGKRAKA